VSYYWKERLELTARTETRLREGLLFLDYFKDQEDVLTLVTENTAKAKKGLILDETY
jgi:hypothetical protein